MAAKFEPIHTIVISDREPHSEEEALQAMVSLTGTVDLIYCGDPKNTHARKFLESLARHRGGQYYDAGNQADAAKRLAPVLRTLLLGTGK